MGFEHGEDDAPSRAYSWHRAGNCACVCWERKDGGANLMGSWQLAMTFLQKPGCLYTLKQAELSQADTYNNKMHSLFSFSRISLDLRWLFIFPRSHAFWTLFVKLNLLNRCSAPVLCSSELLEFKGHMRCVSLCVRSDVGLCNLLTLLASLKY